MQTFIDLLNRAINFQFVKFGDGEMLAMLRARNIQRFIGGYQDNKNADGALISAEVGQSLWDAYAVLLSRADSYLGNFMSYVESTVESPSRTFILEDYRTYITNTLPEFANHPRTVSAWLLYHSTATPDVLKVKEFYKTLSDSARPKVFVGPARLAGAARMLRATHIVTSETDAFETRAEILRNIKPHIQSYAILMFSCGFAAKRLMADCLGINGNMTCLDIGSSLDPVFVGTTRNEQLPKEQLQILYADLIDATASNARKTLQEFTGLIQTSNNFQFVKFGDGELISMLIRDPDSCNCDGSLMSPQVGVALWDAYQTLLPRGDCYLGSFIDDVKKYDETWADLLLSDYRTMMLPRLPLIDTHPRSVGCGLLINSIYNTEWDVLKLFYKEIAKSVRPKVFVGPVHLRGLAVLFDAYYVEVPAKDSFYSRAKLVAELTPLLKNDTIIMFSAGFSSKILTADCLGINDNITCIDLGSAFDSMLSAPARTGRPSKDTLQKAYSELFPKISILIPHLGREDGLEKCRKSIAALNYPSSRIEVLVDDRVDPTVPEKVKHLAGQATGDYLCYASNDIEFDPDSILNAVVTGHLERKKLVSFNTGPLLPDNGNIAEHFIVHRTLIPDLGGEIFDTEFTHVGVDNLLWAKASKLNQATRSPEARITHHHFSKGTEFDAVYARGWANVSKDRALLAKKLELLDS